MAVAFLISNKLFTDKAKRLPDVEEAPGHKGTELSKAPIELKGGDWVIKVVPWIGGRIVSMMHLPSGNNFNFIEFS